MREPARMRTAGRPLSATLEREIAQILVQSAPRRQQDGPLQRVISVLCVEINGFVGHCERLEPERVGAILSVYVGAMADSVDSYFGSVQVVMGDCVLASWNATHPQPDHALLAVSAAIDMVERTDDINRRLQAEELPQVACAIGINTGAALVRATGSRTADYEIVGDAVNIALLLAAAAPPGGILVAEGTKVSLGGDILLEPTEISSLPGKEKPVRVFRVLGRMTLLDEG